MLIFLGGLLLISVVSNVVIYINVDYQVENVKSQYRTFLVEDKKAYEDLLKLRDTEIRKLKEQAIFSKAQGWNEGAKFREEQLKKDILEAFRDKTEDY